MHPPLAPQAPLFSVVIPTYNRSGTIGDALRSLAAQVCRSFEAVIVDDGSEDFENLQSVAEAFRHELDIRIVRHETQRNGAAARNTGIHAALGSYIAFLDSDDWWDRAKLERCRQTLEENRWPKDWFLYSRARMVDSNGVEVDVLHARAIHASETLGEYLFCGGTDIPTSTIVCSREFALRIRFDERFVRHQDYDFCLRAAAAGARFEFIPEILTNWRMHTVTAGERARNVRVGETPSYCKFWLSELQPYLNRNAYFGYRIRVLARRCSQNGEHHAYYTEVLRGFLHIGWKYKLRYVRRAALMCVRKLTALPHRLRRGIDASIAMRPR
ncbi:MAG TPA: glycosyltransferase [Steroidobacteraceae bacterium]|nr:glycosyltransferase [Steroidobacteraceae bacterium]